MQRDRDSSDSPPESRTSGPGRSDSDRGEDVGSTARTTHTSGGYFPGENKYFPGEDKHPALITAAAPSLDQQYRARVKRYAILMGFRIPCLVLAAVAYGLWANALISLAIIGVSIPLPWIAVLIANDRPPRSKDEPSRWDGRGSNRALGSGPDRAIDN